MQPLDFQNLSGQRLGQYQLRQLLGQGGMGAVFRAYQERLDREVAVKVIFSQLAQDNNYQMRFEREAWVAAALEHTHIVPIYDYGMENGVSFIVMRLLNGGSLQERVLRGTASGGMALNEVARITGQLASALQYAHDRDVIHRDVKANNVMFDDRDNAILVDFGIARLLSTELDLTRTGMNIGSPAFMAPEQWRNEALGPAVDQYTLAILVYYMLTNRLLFTNDETYQWMHSHLYDVPTPLQQWRSDLPPTLMPVLLRALAKHPEARYPNVEAFGTAFQEAVIVGEQATSSPSSVLVSHEQSHDFNTRILPPLVEEDSLEPIADSTPTRKSRNPLVIMGVLLAGLVAIISLVALSGVPPETPAGSGAGVAAAADASATPTNLRSTEQALGAAVQSTATLRPTATHTQQPSATFTHVPSATNTSEPTATVTERPTETPVPTLTATVTRSRPSPTATATLTNSPTAEPTFVAMVSNPVQLSLPVTVIENGPLAQVDAEIVCDLCAAMDLVIQFDPAIIHIKGLGVDPVLGDWLIDNTTGIVQLTTAGLAPDGWNDSPISLRFYVRGQQLGTSRFDIAGVVINDEAGSVQDVNIVNGVVIVTSVEPTPVVNACEYRVQTGDTLSGIAVANGVTIADINAVNELPNANVIYVGQVLTIPASVCHAPVAGGVASSGAGELINVHDCRYVGNDVFEWYSVQREYDSTGNPISDTRVGGPFTGPWQPGCPQGGTSSSGSSNGGSSNGGGSNNGGGSSGGGNSDDDDGGVCVLVICVG